MAVTDRDPVTVSSVTVTVTPRDARGSSPGCGEFDVVHDDVCDDHRDDYLDERRTLLHAQILLSPLFLYFSASAYPSRSFLEYVQRTPSRASLWQLVAVRCKFRDRESADKLRLRRRA